MNTNLFALQCGKAKLMVLCAFFLSFTFLLFHLEHLLQEHFWDIVFSPYATVHVSLTKRISCCLLALYDANIWACGIQLMYVEHREWHVKRVELFVEWDIHKRNQSGSHRHVHLLTCASIFLSVWVCECVSVFAPFCRYPLLRVPQPGSFIPSWAAPSPVSPGDKENVAFSPGSEIYEQLKVGGRAASISAACCCQAVGEGDRP